jgi:ATP-binding protein involved in chromosome partitioning
MMKAPLRIPGISHLLAVASGKGGVGKTTVAVNLALALQQSGARVGLFDADLYGPNVPLMLGIRRRRASAGFIPIARSLSVPYIPPLERYGLAVMSIGLVVGDDDTVMPDPFAAGHIIRQTLQDVRWGPLDILLLDFPPGTGEPQQTLLETVLLDGVLIVTTPQDLSLMDASRSLGVFRQAGVPILGVIENMSYLNCPHCGQAIEVFHRSRREWSIDGEAVPRLGRIPMDLAISRGIDSGHPLVQVAAPLPLEGAADGPSEIPASPAVTAFREVAGRVLQLLAQDEP